MKTLQPTEFQHRVLSVPEHVNLLLPGGRGGGKSYALMFLALRHCVTYKSRAKVLIVRKQLKSLAQMTVQLLGLFRSAYGKDVSYNGGTNMFTLPDGATVQLAYCDGAADLVSIAQGMSFSAIFIDEAGSAPAIEVIDELALALRADPDVPTRLALFANPASTNHATLYARYMRGREPWRVFEYGGDPRKGQLIEQLTGAGQFEVETAARLAVMQGDIVLAAAVLVVVDRKSRDRRPFAISDLAERVMGPQFKDADRKLKAVQLAYRDAVAADLEFNRGGPNPTARISSYLAHRALTESESYSLTE